MIWADAICVARYSQDGEWYRAKVEKELPDRKVALLFIDYGNREITNGAKCAQLPTIPGASAPGYAKEYTLACITLPSDVISPHSHQFIYIEFLNYV